MYKLNGHGLSRGEWFRPESQSVTLSERSSASSITIGPDGPEIGFNDWLLDDDWPEGWTVWRIKSNDSQRETETGTIQLEHAIRILEDSKIPDGIETAEISGGDTATARQTILYLLAMQSDWALGECDYDRSLPYEFTGGESILDAIESVTETLEDSEWRYDMSQYPFVLHIKRRDTSVACEMRRGRNISTMRRSVNRTGMYTRIYPVGKNDLHISGNYISKNESLYGRVDKVETDQGKTSEESLRAWASGRLRRHCEPVVTITIGGLELSQETGESLDWIQLNRVCRCPLPEYNTTIKERVIKLQWRDRIKEPENVTVTLGNNTADVTDLTKQISETSKYAGSGGRAARGQAKQNYMFEVNGEHLLYEVFDECGHLHGVLRMTEQSLRVAFENLNECTRSELYLTSESLRVTFENEIQCARSEFQMTSESLRVTFENEIASTRSLLEMTSESLRVQFENEISSTRSEFQMTSESLRVTFEDEISSTRSLVEQTDRSWKAAVSGVAGSDGKVTAASIAVAINDAGEGVATIDADKVYIGNAKSTTVIAGKCSLSDVTADYISGKIASLSVLNVAAISATGNITTSNGVVMAPYIYLGGVGSARSLANAITALQISRDGDTYTLKKQDFDDSSWVEVGSFSRATTLTGTWGSGKFTVNASPQGESFWTDLVQGAVSWDGNTGTIPINAIDKDGGGNSYFTGRNVSVDASNIYNKAIPASGKASGRNGSAWNWDFIITKNDGTTKSLTIDVSDIVVAARSGYTLGTFTQATVTPQGASDSVYVEVSSGGTNYYKAGTKATYYNAGKTYTYYAAGSSATYYNAGTTKKTAIGKKHTPSKKTGYLRGSEVTGTNQGSAWNSSTYPLYYKYGDSYIKITATLYYGGSSYEHYAGGSSFTYYDVGTSEDCYEAGSEFTVQGSTATVTKQGKELSVTVQGTSVEVTPISGSALMLAATTRYKAGTKDTTTYYTKS